MKRSDRRVDLVPAGRAGVGTRVRFSPQVLIILPAIGLAFFGLRGAIGDAIYLWFASSYAQVDFVMEELQPNSGVPIIPGHIEPGGEAAVTGARLFANGGGAVEADPRIAFTPGASFRVWWSDRAPSVGLGGTYGTQAMPVSAMPRLPGWLNLLGNLAWIAGALLGGMWVVAKLRLRTVEKRSLVLLD